MFLLTREEIMNLSQIVESGDTILINPAQPVCRDENGTGRLAGEDNGF